ncbi:hypothetical protein RclHR1_01430017 [Rhizophagus clarus]|uniref:Uncharacterized protein n=1 Tax=Rhizophagus clarus TaxID=94130 RepID=A0A2Z6R4Y1_9GLOM|nr:hypothetical protein RclHR1_01430017 [Rhizophagus clarus]
MQKIYNNYKSGFNQFNQLQDNDDNENIINKRNYNIDFLLIALRDTLHSLRDDDTWFQEIIRRSKELLKTIFSFELPKTGVAPCWFNIINTCSIKHWEKEKKEKGIWNQNAYSTSEQILKSDNILKIIANEMICSIGQEPRDQLCILKCQHILSFDNFKN